MIRLFSPGIQEGFIRWATRRQRVAANSIELGRRRIFILPTRNGMLFGIVLVFMLMGAIHYSNSLAFLLTFLLTGLSGIAMWQTHRNLLGLQITKGTPRPVFTGNMAKFPLELHNPGRRPRIALALQWQDAPITVLDIESTTHTQVALLVPARHRGWLKPGRFRLYTRFPLGLFQAWTWMEFDWAALSYPKPVKCALPGNSLAYGEMISSENQLGNDDFMGLRDYRPGDSSRHVAWKALAHNEQALTKLFSSGRQEELWLDWGLLPGAEPELRLSMLCHQVIETHQSGRNYGLRLPRIEVAPGHGEAHKNQCLKVLALYEQ
jgi:uncharacterized protein (DUF58 family)